jgi:cysteine synthase B
VPLNHYLNDRNLWLLPIVRIPDELNPFSEDGVEIEAALGYFLPYDNVKFLTVLGLLRGARKAGKLEGIHTLVEMTSGNTGLILAALAPALGIPNVKLVIAPDLPAGKRDPLTIAGAKFIYPENGVSGIATARELGKQKGWCNLDQYANLDGTILHEQWAAPKMILKGVASKIFVAGIGTGGTLIGIARHLRAHFRDRTTVGVLLSPGNEIPGVRDLNRMREITLPWREASDFLTYAETKPACLASVLLNRSMGIMCGLSSGFAYFGGLKFLAERKTHDNFDSFRDHEGKIRVMVFFPDSCRPYGDRYMANVAFTDPEYVRPETLFAML